MKQTFGTSPEYDKAVSKRLWQIWCESTDTDVLFAIYKAGQKGYKLEDLTLDNLKKFKGGVA